MTKREYAAYESAVAEFFEREGINCLTTDVEANGEGDFSWRPCECCGTTLAGDRETASGYNPTTREILSYVVCRDCVYYAEYSQLDDMTMLDMEDE
jgi:hypothetical protein